MADAKFGAPATNSNAAPATAPQTARNFSTIPGPTPRSQPDRERHSDDDPDDLDRLGDGEHEPAFELVEPELLLVVDRQEHTDAAQGDCEQRE